MHKELGSRLKEIKFGPQLYGEMMQQYGQHLKEQSDWARQYEQDKLDKLSSYGK